MPIEFTLNGKPQAVDVPPQGGPLMSDRRAASRLLPRLQPVLADGDSAIPKDDLAR